MPRDIDWKELQYGLFKARILLLRKEIDSETADELVDRLLYLDSHNPKKKDITLFISCPGGDLDRGIHICDVIKSLEADVRTVACLETASVASLILATGTKNKRLAFPESKIMMYEPFIPPAGWGAEEVPTLKDIVIEMYAEVTGRPAWQISADLGRKFFMTAEEARQYGIIDEIFNW